MAAGLLSSLRVVEFDGMGPTPFAAKMLADLGAEVVRVARAGASDRAGAADMLANRTVVRVDLKSSDGHKAALDLIATADGVLEGFRPGVMERLGLGPDICLRTNPRLAYVRLTGWGQDGPLAPRAGHDLNYLSITGVLNAIGPADQPPPPPLNLLGDYGGGSTFAVIGLLTAVLHARETGKGQVIDAAMVDSVAALSTAIHGLMNSGGWRDERAANTLDGGAPFYRCYACSDGKFISVAALEPQFFGLLLDGLEIERTRFDQRDRAHWAEMEATFRARFATRTRDQWAAVFEITDACVAPVLSFAEARTHPHNIARQTFRAALPAAAPRFAEPAYSTSHGEGDIEEIVARWGTSPKRDVALTRAGLLADDHGQL
ncbi:CaiB/BaiF CoA transferase family protein [Sphingopyxis sp. 113P3]|uniref:CaiB/BaiF CoA transferase family protein n=1 Tax=Sphingopyxis sp. (strain 113P3) TaxID=292913 RepID=UPI0006AD2E45|nr:CaiB/BaiF CoA-transferase family protein [Sphingopyxis sp. 113P3]ALC14174.1 carnitine dehydratase [Sphingopyxis sp. 113P3]